MKIIFLQVTGEGPDVVAGLTQILGFAGVPQQPAIAEAARPQLPAPIAETAAPAMAQTVEPDVAEARTPKSPAKTRNFKRSAPAGAAPSPSSITKRAVIRAALKDRGQTLDVLAAMVRNVNSSIDRNYVSVALSQMSREGMVELSADGIWSLSR